MGSQGLNADIHLHGNFLMGVAKAGHHHCLALLRGQAHEALLDLLRATSVVMGSFDPLGRRVPQQALADVMQEILYPVFRSRLHGDGRITTRMHYKRGARYGFGGCRRSFFKKQT